MRARLVLRERWVVGEREFADVAIWQVPEPVSRSTHAFKYRLAFVVNDICVLRFDNEAGKGDHKHYREQESPYSFSNLDQLIIDFMNEIERWRRQ